MAPQVPFRRMPERHSLLLVLPLCAVPLLGQTQEPAGPMDPAPREWVGGLPIWEWTRLTGDWGGLRTRLEDAGLEFGDGYTVDIAAPWSGDTRRRASVSTLFDLNVALDLEVLAGLPRTLAFVDAYQLEGRDPSGDVGDFQGLSNIQGDDVAIVAEVWIETWLHDTVRVKVGKVDFNSEFAFHEIGGEFVHSTPGILPTIVGYPTFPDPATSVNVFYVPDERWHLGVAVYDGAAADGVPTGSRGPSTFFRDNVSSAWFLCAEAGYAWAGGERWGAGRAVLGGFHHTATFATFAGGSEDGTSGLWASLEQRLWRENAAADDGQGVGAFVAIGLADDSVSACGKSLTCGVEWLGALAGRDQDVLGFGVHFCDLSDDPGAGTPADETTFELLYKLALTPAVSLKPELQYILDAGGQDGVDAVLVGLLRIEILF